MEAKTKAKIIQKIIDGNTSEEASKIILNMLQPNEPESNIKAIDSLEDAIGYMGESDEDVIRYRKMLSAEVDGHPLRYIELVVIIKAVNKLANGGKIWIPDWDNPNEKKRNSLDDGSG